MHQRLAFAWFDDGGPRPKTEGDEISDRFAAMTLQDYLMARHRISRETVRRFLSPIEGRGYGLGPDALSAHCAWAIETEFPEDGDEALGDQMFPDGNATFARLMVKTLVPGAFAGPRTVDTVTREHVRVSACRWFGGLGDYLAVRKMATVAGRPATFGPDSPTFLTIKVLFAPGGFDPKRDIAGIILNRWGHAYVNPQPGFYLGLDDKPAPREILRDRPHGRIAFANTDLAGAADHRNSIREADRAVRQPLGT